MMGMKQKEENAIGGLHNSLTTGTIVKGNVKTETDFRLDGQIEGDVDCDGKFVIGPKGRVTGNIVSTSAEILGEVNGTVRTGEKLVLKSTGNINGDIFVKSLEIEPGARFNGVCSMSSEEAVS